MDEAVVRAMARWPNVPDVYGWLSLDRRGQWRLQGGTIGNEALRAFISRNYLALPDGRHAFQNGPQRVFVELEYTPWVASLDGTGTLKLHTGAQVHLTGAAWMDEAGALLLEVDEGIALVDDRDLETLTATLLGADGARLDEAGQIDAVEQLLGPSHQPLTLVWRDAQIRVEFIDSGEVPARFGFEPAPAAPAA